MSDDQSKKPEHKIVMAVTQNTDEAISDDLKKSGFASASESQMSPLLHALNQANGVSSKKAPRLAFDQYPSSTENYLGLFRNKRRLLPDDLIKQIRVSDHLIAAILRSRGNMLSLFGHLRKDRFDVGLEIFVKPEILNVLTPEQFVKVKDRVKKLEYMLLHCGQTEGLENHHKLTLADFLSLQIQNGLAFGRFATEIIYDRTDPADENGDFPFHSFRPVDVGTIYHTIRKGESIGDEIRTQAIKALASLSGDKIAVDMKRFEADEFAWAQIIEGQIREAFTHKELLVYNLFPSTDIEHNGYPVSPLDTIISAVTTHISIDAYKKLYFQNGRASKGMLVIRSDEVDEQVLNSLKLQFNASINSVSNSFRTPIFGIGKEDDVQWLPTNEGARDDDFAFMYDQVARNILSAFNVSPDELPGYSHLSRGTNSQTLSESNNEFRLTASRDSGLRPIILKLQQFFNQHLLPIMDKHLAQICELRFSGLDAQNVEQESARLQQNSALHMTYDEILAEVDKVGVGESLGGNFPFNERYQLVLDKTVDIGTIKAHLMDDPSAIVDPLLRYKRDPFYLQWVSLAAQSSPNSVAALFAPRPPQLSLEILKMYVNDSIEGEDDNGA